MSSYSSSTRSLWYRRVALATVAVLAASACILSQSNAPAAAFGPTDVPSESSIERPIIDSTAPYDIVRDCGMSTPLRDGRHLWLYCDTFSAGPGLTNSAALATPSTPDVMNDPLPFGYPLNAVYDSTLASQALAWCTGTSKVPVFWPMALGTVPNNVAGTDDVYTWFKWGCQSSDNGQWIVNTPYVGVARWTYNPANYTNLSPASMPPISFQILNAHLFLNTGQAISGSPYVGSNLYLSRCDAANCISMRVNSSNAASTSAYRFWTGSAWSTDVNQATATISDPANGVPGSLIHGLSYVPSLGKYALSYVTFGTAQIRLAAAPQGPWGAPWASFKLSGCYGNSSLCRQLFVHDQLTTSESLGLTYASQSPYGTFRTELPAVSYSGTSMLSTPQRIVDTRTGLGGTTGPISAAQSFSVVGRGIAGIPSTATGLIANVTIIGGSTASWVQLTSTGLPSSLVSSVNASAGDTIANLTEVHLGPSGQFTISRDGSTGGIQVVVDIVGWHGPGGTQAVTTNSPARAFDSRPNPLGPGTKVDVDLSAWVPPTATAAVINLTAVAPSQATHLSAAAFGSPLPPTSALNAPTGTTRANMAVVALGTGSKMSVWNNAGNSDVIVDVVGWYAPGSGNVQLVSPSRTLDTRVNAPDPYYQIGWAYQPGVGSIKPRAIGPGETLYFKVARVGGVPASAKGVILNATAVGPTAATHLVVWKTGTAMPGTSNVNLAAGGVQAFSVQVDIGTNGYVSVFNNSGSTHVIFDVAGWYS